MITTARTEEAVVAIRAGDTISVIALFESFKSKYQDEVVSSTLK